MTSFLPYPPIEAHGVVGTTPCSTWPLREGESACPKEADMRIDRARRDLRHSGGADAWQRRASIGLSLIGMASMVPPALLQTGIVRHLPDPPIRGFDSDKVNLSRDAFPFGLPDATLALMSFASNVPLAAAGGADRAERMPWLPLLAFGKAARDAAVAGWYFAKMPTKEKAWCAYCIAAFLANLGLLALALPEARQAWAALRRR
jgi:uncharacterized membrane protein